jgi:bacteriorhodopsin
MYWVTGILGLILGAAPWMFGYSTNMVALWTSLIVGAATIIVSIVEAAQADRQQWEYWTAGVLGLIAIIAPFVFGFGNYANAMWSSVVLGILIAIFAGSRAFTLGKS